MNHLNEDMLIQYAYDLFDDDVQKEQVASHLAQCDECAEKLGQLQQKFATLDILSEEEVLSEELMGKMLTTAAQKPETPSGNFHRTAFVWIAAAAAVLVVGLFVFHEGPEKPSLEKPSRETPFAKAPATDKPQETVTDNHPGLTATGPSKGGEFAGDLLAKDQDSDGASLVSSLPVKGEAAARGEGIMAVTADGSVAAGAIDPLFAQARIVDAEAIPEKAPFAPASAIELVVLPAPDETQVTIYNSADLTLVRDTRKLTLKPGWNWLQFMWNGTQIDPTSLSLRPLEHTAHIDVELLSYPARLKDIGRWLIRSEVEGAVPFEITYFAGGLSWRAFYMGTMNADETTMSLKGYVNVANQSGQDFRNAQTRLIVGETRLTESIADLAERRYPYGPEIDENTEIFWRGFQLFEVIDDESKINMELSNLRSGLDFDGGNGDLILGDTPMVGGAFYSIKDIEKEGLSEYFLYTIEGTEDLPNTWSKRLPSFDADDIPVKSLYKYDEDRYGGQTVRFVSFANDAEHELGETPIPEGSIKICRSVNSEDNLSYVGGSDFKYIPVNEDVELNLGSARLVKVEPVLMDRQTDHYTFDKKRNITGWDEIETWQLKTANTRDIPIALEITRNFGTETWDIKPNRDQCPVTYKKHDKHRARFTLTVPPQTETMFTYTVTKYQGRRAEIYVKKLQEQKR